MQNTGKMVFRLCDHYTVMYIEQINRTVTPSCSGLHCHVHRTNKSYSYSFMLRSSIHCHVHGTNKSYSYSFMLRSSIHCHVHGTNKSYSYSFMFRSSIHCHVHRTNKSYSYSFMFKSSDNRHASPSPSHLQESNDKMHATNDDDHDNCSYFNTFPTARAFVAPALVWPKNGLLCQL